VRLEPVPSRHLQKKPMEFLKALAGAPAQEPEARRFATKLSV
jgi:hypothetical protein